MPATCWLAQGALRRVTIDPQSMVVSYLGDRHSGPFSLAVRQMKYLVGAIEYFTKWIEAEPVTQIIAHKVQHFVWKNIVCRFGVLKRLVSDNGT